MEKTKNLFIKFHVNIDECVRFTSETKDHSHLAIKDVFRVNGYYFYYVYNRNEKLRTHSLREINEEEFKTRRRELLNIPPKGVNRWMDDKNTFSIGHYYTGYWERGIPASDCIFITKNNPLQEVHEAVLCEASIRKYQEDKHEKAEKYEYARKCGGLGRKLGIAYQNALRIGPEKGKLMQFKESYERAIKSAEEMSLAEARQTYNSLLLGRNSRKLTLDKLGIKYFDVDVNLLDLTELENLLGKRLESYATESIKLAKQNAANADYATRQRMYDDLMGSSRRQRREVLKELGVEVDALDLNKYPLSEIKRVLAATLGLDVER